MTHSDIAGEYQYRGPGRPPGSPNKPKVEPADLKDHSVGAELLQFFERIERLDGERQERTEDMREVFAEAKSRGFDVKAMRTILRHRKMDHAERQEAEAIVELYERALEAGA